MPYYSFKFAFIAAAITAMLAAPQIASAQDQPPAAPPAGAPQAPSMKAACGPDLANFCPDLKGRKARKCLRAHRKELSSSCAAYFKARRAAAKGTPPAAPPQQ